MLTRFWSLRLLVPLGGHRGFHWLLLIDEYPRASKYLR